MRLIRAFIALIVGTLFTLIVIGNSPYHPVRELFTVVDISAPPAKVWNNFAAFQTYPQWNPFITSLSGDPRPGATLKVHIAPPGAMSWTFHPTVLTYEPNHELTWLGRFLIPGLFDGQHTFTVEPDGTGGARFIQRERFTGVLVPFMWDSLKIHTAQGFKDMNQALKKRCEQP